MIIATHVRCLLPVLAAVLVGVTVAPPASAALPAHDAEGRELPSLAPMLDEIMPAVVNISTVSRIRAQDNPLLRDPFFRWFFNFPERPRQRKSQSLGSGVIIDADNGYVLTNHHVIDKADEIRVTLADGREPVAEVVGTDPEADIAVIRISATDLTELRLADSNRLRVGDFVVAIGNPFGLGQTVTSGIVSALGRSGLGIEGYEDFIQTDASINPGNSGGALVNLRGELVGINTAILAPSGGNVGIGFAIPSNMARRITEQLIEFGEVRRGRLGVAVQDLTPELARALGTDAVDQGAVVVDVGEGTTAQRAGLASGDVIIGINGREIDGSADLRNAVGLLRVGDEVELDILRDGERITRTAVIGAPSRDHVDGGSLDPRLAGAVFGPIDERSPWHGRLDGVMVLEVEPGSEAHRGGLRAGDIVTSVNRKAVGSLKELTRAAQAGKGRGVLLNIRRGEMALFILLR